jgi:hypothetical protein
MNAVVEVLSGNASETWITDEDDVNKRVPIYDLQA